jgi:UDP-N-acetylglucosamine--N-acetylmuramyl-(pentapeptide) pyrophosphoryl-undecaprenol N-acetylglucosamine transferase
VKTKLISQTNLKNRHFDFMETRKLNRVLLSAGGTGGHIFPAIAVANEIKSRFPNCEILFVGAEGKMEMEKVPQAGYKIVGLPIAGLQRKLTLSNFLLPIKILKSMLKAKSVVNEFRPEIAVGFGGYASGPTLRAAGTAGVPTVLQEQNSFAGVTNKLLAKRAQAICVAYEGMNAFFQEEKIQLTGNPVRKEFVNLPYSQSEALSKLNFDSTKKTILIIGGSLGARAVNAAVEASLQEWLSKGFQVIWQCGKIYKSNLESKYSETGGLLLFDFIQDMALVYAAADVIVSRAGAMSVSELSLVGKPVVFMPSPNVAEDHQTKNAMALVSKGAAVMVKDSEAEMKLAGVVSELLHNENEISTLKKNIIAFARPNATEEIVDTLIEVVYGKA